MHIMREDCCKYMVCHYRTSWNVSKSMRRCRNWGGSSVFSKNWQLYCVRAAGSVTCDRVAVVVWSEELMRWWLPLTVNCPRTEMGQRHGDKPIHVFCPVTGTDRTVTCCPFTGALSVTNTNRNYRIQYCIYYRAADFRDTVAGPLGTTEDMLYIL